MRHSWAALGLAGILASQGMVELLAADWPQFRGPRSAGLATDGAAYPAKIGPGENVVWRTELPPGHSSPVLVGDKIFLGAVRGDELLTMALDRATGKVLWERAAPHDRLESIHRIGSHAQCTPAADETCVVSFFGSSGLFCYDHSGELLWQRKMGPFNNDFGAGSSPILSNGRVILAQDHDTDSFLMVLDQRTGETIWQIPRSEFLRNYSSPVLWEQGERTDVVLAGTLRVAGYDLATGQERWTVRGISRTVCMTPVVGDDGCLYVAGWAAGGDEGGEALVIEPFNRLIAEADANRNGGFEEDELPTGAIKQRFVQVDRDKDGTITEPEYEYFREIVDKGRNLVLSIRPGAEGEATETHVRWKQARLVPFCASPLYVDGLVFTVKDGGIVSCLNAATGKPTKQGRLEANGNYYASPVAADGKVYLLDEQGRLTVLSANDKWETLHTASFGEDGYATPAVVDGKVYLRTAKALYAFGEPQ